MRKYLSLGGAMMMGSVIGKSDKSLLPAKYELQPAQVLGIPTEQHIANFNFAHAKPIPQPEPTIQKGRRYEVEEDVITSHCTSHDNQRVNNRRDYEERSLTTPDNSLLTSASILVENYYSPLSVEVEGMAHGAAIEEVSVVTSCDEVNVQDGEWDDTQSVEDNFGYYGQSKLVNVNRHHDDWNNDWESNKRNIHGEDDYEVRHSHNHH
ncbi:hypothetical protein FGO68_gene7446 [Halteria grandinella]|uniref:Uncharacterized protein n=1 Tax=Halteria grandinella TaxID=5974 RepID=A0A8J8NLW8_HALGN|nr:hypothetical protein FGO68_gene7446 [Halteria grandinella]